MNDLQYPDRFRNPIVWLHYGPVGPPDREMAPACQQGTILNVIFEQAPIYPNNMAAAMPGVHHG
ncbi:hypothetical protein BH10PSE12_BH10PSE12_18930 [soil metagenome]